jgi:hypothetical protein
MIRLPAEIDSQIAGADNMVRRIDQRSRESFPFAKEIVKAWGGLEPVLDWCKGELQGEWRWQLVDMSSDIRPGRYIFYFDDEAEYLAFLMKWS